MSLIKWTLKNIPSSDVKGIDGKEGFVSSRKVLLVGDPGVGKTTLVKSYLDWKREDSYSILCSQPKFYFDEYYTEFLFWDQTKSVIFYDIQEECEDRAIFGPVMSMGLNLVVLCFSIDDPDSLENVEDIWCPRIDLFLPHVPKILVGLKSDVRKEQFISQETLDMDMDLASYLDALDIQERRRICFYLECSALTGRLILQFKQSHFLLAKSFLDSPVNISPHKSLNTSRGVVSEPDLLTTPEAEILDGFSDQGDTGQKNNKKIIVIPTKHLILTFNSPTLPKTIKTGYLNCKIRLHIPNPLLCFKCQRFGHSQTACRGQSTCSRYASVGHAFSDCNLEQKCVNCSQPHSADSKLCPKWKIERDPNHENKQNISYVEARKLIVPQT
ncbi:RNA-directed DNA polymerase from mobile element jockey [Trichonephila clavipes]|nr:RNA-directed DNA polymerase from mobile element jockey [Trichonephila clavipes]